jgi:hypothetical protein
VTQKVTEVRPEDTGGRREVSEETNSENTLTSDFNTKELRIKEILDV